MLHPVENVEALFRVTGREPELWSADSGDRRATSWHVRQGRTVMPLRLDSYDSVFVVFRKPTDRGAHVVPMSREMPVMFIDGDWEVTFERDRGAPCEAQRMGLDSWTNNPAPGIKYFSGVATYRITFALERRSSPPGARWILDLGEVHELAEVFLNGHCVGTAWHPAFRLDVTDALRAGTNALEVHVANLWVNRLIGDQQPGTTDPVAFVVTSTYSHDAPLRPSGLLGPVRLLMDARQE